jgi:hypothetical protein
MDPHVAAHLDSAGRELPTIVIYIDAAEKMAAGLYWNDPEGTLTGQYGDWRGPVGVDEGNDAGALELGKIRRAAEDDGLRVTWLEEDRMLVVTGEAEHPVIRAAQGFVAT